MRTATITKMLFVLCAFGQACSKESPPAAAEPRSPSAESSVMAQPAQPTQPGQTEPAAAVSAPATAEAQPATAGKPRFAEDNFELVIQSKGAYKAGQAGEAEIVLSAKDPFHVNDKYPYKFKGSEAPGLKLGAPIVTKEAVKLEPKRATMVVAFTPESAGKHTLSGQFSFSVCTDDKCLVEKRDLALEITAN
ncbi:MAG TPA: hypothetical protein VGP93_01025 [Polyangiaceae bacterium]|jgi:hypothetical protein|nr:hypothetical protein [Polyangiaceae bacterium]